MAYVDQVQELKERYIYKSCFGETILEFNPFKLKILRSEENVGYSGLGVYKDIHGDAWDVTQVVGPLVWCEPRKHIQDWVYSTATDRGLFSSSPTDTSSSKTQHWWVQVNITNKQDPDHTKTIEDLYSDVFEFVGTV